MNQEAVRVLLIDDDEDQFVLTRALLAEAAGDRFHLEWVDTYEKGLEHIQQCTHDIYLLDYHLNTGSGLELLQQAVNQGCQAPIILLSGQGDQAVDLAATELGAADYLEKSNLTCEMLERSLRYTLAQSYSRKAIQSHADDLGLINALNLAVNRGDSMGDIFDLLARETGRIFGGTGAGIYMLAPDRQHMRLQARFFPAHLSAALEELTGTTLPPVYQFRLRPDSWYARVLRNGRCELVNDPASILKIIADTIDDPIFHQMAPRMQTMIGAQSIVGCPLGSGEAAVGVLDISRPTPFTPADMLRLETISEHVLAVLKRREAETSLRQNEQMTRSLLDATSDSVGLLDREYRFVTANAAMAVRLETNVAELIGTCARDLLAPGLAKTRRQRLEQVFETGEMAVFEDRRAGFTFHNTVYPMLDTAGDVTQLAVFARDITALKEAEAQQERLQAQLLESQKMEAVGRLSAGIAHDFNNLLTAINGFTELLLLECADHEAHHMLESVLRSGQRAARLVQQLLAFSRRQMTFPRSMNLNQSLAQAEESLRQTAGPAVKLAVIAEPDLWPVLADPDQVRQLLDDLAANARDSMPGGGHLIFQTSNARLSAEQVAEQPEASPGDYVLLRVTDTGRGFGEEERGHLFEPFYFSSQEVADERGLRLAAVFGMVKQNAGHIWVDSHERAGATFHIYLPRHQPG